MSADRPFDPEHPGVDDGRIEFSSIGEGHFIFEDKNLVYSEEDQAQHELEAQLAEESHTDVNATVLWKHVVKGRKCGNSHGGSHVFKCKHCQKIYHGTYTRVYAHLMGHKKGESKGIGYCSIVKADKNLQLQIKREVEQVESSPNVVPLKKSKLNASSGATSQGPSLALSYAGSFEKDSLTQDRDDVDSKVIRCLCANGIPFDVLRSPYWDEMVSAISKEPGYKSPSCERASTILLQNERIRVESELDIFKQKWSHYGISIQTSGWMDTKHRPLINLIASNQFGSMFLHALDFLVIEKSHKRITHYMMDAIEKVGPYNVVQLITDNSSHCRAVGEDVMKAYPHIFWTPCIVHTLTLVLKDVIKELRWLKEIYLNAKAIVRYIIYHFNAAEDFFNYSKLELLKSATRPYGFYYIFHILFDVRETLVAAVLSDQWDIWSRLPILDEKVQLCGESVKEGVLSEDFWKGVQLALSIAKPIFKMIKFTDQEGPLIGEICERMDNMLGEIQDNLKKHEDMFMIVKEKLHSRWTKNDVPMQCLAYALTPKYYDEDFIQTSTSGGRKRRPPDQDDDIFEGAMAAICKMHPNDDRADTVRVQFLLFVEKKGKFSSPTAKRDARNPKINVLQWWKFHGGDTKELRDMAFRVLAQPISAYSVEKPWSTYSFIHHAKRNQLNESQADDLMFVHSNLRLLLRFNQNYQYGQHRKWDANPGNILMDESPLWEEMHEDESSFLSQTSTTHSSIQELLRIIEDVPSNYNQSAEGSRLDSTGKTKKFL
ncbi:uncharacterized protein LOC110036238 isoform X2 [Phalaenopsis equestris]|uniref:uncharacterized protein LOC110036238 isoform X2 n=1 Tax=Phalaenopsis equestris TaxID=78828 RepID=UPI0009E28E53|nr:uncharacterized protein LOC110036238 isoform X2 [Phalaenopsis equestris]XP_020596294.1 uncharacterized protein LOC110036238 isoform X2 [Phalaenopsis equestris]XP_020596295.1 uncharacterized protein LOC110036238 isoform X2 [Phalaenopsis equestris]XP_020596296.1 uncharacterized protein LOC110036238 isoform X2 [Phalaenopsis equestris]XP_020596297.1 uncharacterized protein LOC110036238 isoform X2 [Phalaenopsis equestris]XP_020596298.1 uncharacterized protein LOC110036238 isoform X2 [Phalaenopsi